MAKTQERKIVDVRDLFGEKKEKINIKELTSQTSDDISPLRRSKEEETSTKISDTRKNKAKLPVSGSSNLNHGKLLNESKLQDEKLSKPEHMVQADDRSDHQQKFKVIHESAPVVQHPGSTTGNGKNGNFRAVNKDNRIENKEGNRDICRNPVEGVNQRDMLTKESAIFIKSGEKIDKNKGYPNSSVHSSSGVETDENPQSDVSELSARKKDLKNRPLPPVPQQKASIHSDGLKTVVGIKSNEVNCEFSIGCDNVEKKNSSLDTTNQGVDSSYHTDDGSHSDDDGSDYYYEDEMTMDFEEEDEDHYPPESRGKQIFKEYDGEDFGKFLNDENSESLPVPKERQKRLRRRKKKEQKNTFNSNASASSGEINTGTVHKKRTLKGRLAAVFLNKVNENREASPTQKQKNYEPGMSYIHSFSFADSKIGNSALNLTKGSDGLTSSDPGDLLPVDVAFGGERKWWQTNTLSARSDHNNSNIMFAPKRQDGNSSLKNTEKNNFDLGELGESIGENRSEFDITCSDFESRRKNAMYGFTDDKQAKSNSIFRRFKKSAKQNIHATDNTVINPIAE